MPYNKIKLLSQLIATDPTQSESANKLAPAIRQVKDFLKTFLGVAFNDDGSLKASAVTSSAITDQSVNGSTANTAATAGKITQGTVSRPDLRNSAVDSTKLDDLAVTTAKLDALAVTAAKLATDAVVTAKVQDLAVTTAKLNDLAVTSGKLAADAVTTAKIANLQVTNAKIADTTIDVTKLAAQTSGKIFVGTGSGVVAATIGGDVTASYAAGVLTLSLDSAAAEAANYSRVAQKFSSGTAGGGSTAGTYVIRTSGWSVIEGSAVSITGGRIRFAAAGNYLVRFVVYAYSIGLHKAKLRQYDATTPVDLIIGTTAAAPAGAQTASHIAGLVSVPAANTDYEILHWCELTRASNGLGFPASVGDDETYVIGEILRVS